jgi:DNA polymerase V
MEHDLTTLANSDAVAVHTGFPNPALDRLAQGGKLALDLNRLLIRQPSSTYLFQVSGNEWEAVGIFDGDVAVIDRALEPRPIDFLLMWQAGGFTICRTRQAGRDDMLWGVITSVIHRYRS